MDINEARQHCIGLTHERSLYQKDRDAIRTLLDQNDALLAIAADALKSSPETVARFAQFEVERKTKGGVV